MASEGTERASGSGASVPHNMTPAEEMRITLAALREQGAPFSEAWPMAFQRLRVRADDPAAEEVRDWKLAIDWAKPHFAAAYYGGDEIAGVDMTSLAEAAAA